MPTRGHDFGHDFKCDIMKRKIPTTDFAKLLTDIRNAGLIDQEIGDQVGLSDSKINKLRNGGQKNVHYDNGLAIVELHKRVVKKINT